MRGILAAIDTGGQIVAHAPTGLGKTAAALAPAIERALTQDRTVVFLTSRLTQHALALETVRRIGLRHNIPIPAVDVVGKKHLCLQEGTAHLTGREFAEHCKALRADGACAYYERLRTGEEHSVATRSALLQIGSRPGATPVEVRDICAESEHEVCPYEVTMILAKSARVIVTDYTYLFNESIREGFLRRLNKDLSDLIIIVDEGHNVPDRVQELATERLTTGMLVRVLRELERNEGSDHLLYVREIGELLTRLADGTRDERIVGREEFLKGLARIGELEPFILALESIAENVRAQQRSSSCGTLAAFLRAWPGDDEGFVRILRAGEVRGAIAFNTTSTSQEKGDESDEEEEAIHPLLRASAAANRPRTSASSPRWPSVELRYRCLDPSVITGPVLRGAHATVVMSGTLTPVAMYAQILGIPEATTLSLPSPFPKRNRLNLIVPTVTTKFTTRSPEMYARIADTCVRTINAVPGNSAVFFPSYALLTALRPMIERDSERTVFVEDSSYSREEREELLKNFRSYKASGATLLGVMGGSFSEGIDLPGDELRAVVVVGLPLARPDLETKAAIDHYERLFRRGWDYAYTFPAFNKTLQTAGRCIRTERDRGVIVFLDERYAWPSYRVCFPTELELHSTNDPAPLIRQFFSLAPESESNFMEDE